MQHLVGILIPLVKVYDRSRQDESADILQQSSCTVQALAVEKKLKLVWVLGYFVLPGNEKADELPKTGAKE